MTIKGKQKLTNVGSSKLGNFFVNESTIQAIEKTATAINTKCGRFANKL